MTNIMDATAETPLQTEAVKPSGTSKRAYLVWLDYMKAIALVWIFINHVAERLFGSPYIANPSQDWPALSERIQQLSPISGYGLLDIPLNLVRYIGWTGDQGVQLFIIISGFGLTLGLLARQSDKPLQLWPFYQRRAERIYPMWWIAHIALAVASVGLPIWDFFPVSPNFYLSFLGVRFTLDTYFYIAPAWWYIGLLIQLYLVYPFLWEVLRRRGVWWLLGMTCLVAFAARGVGLLTLDSYIGLWSRGAIFITRLPEFVFGMALAYWLYRANEGTDQWLRANRTIYFALAAYAVGMVLSLFLLGMVVALFLLGAGAFAILYRLLGGNDSSEPTTIHGRAWQWIGQHSYSLYIVHHPAILILIPAGVALDSPGTLGRIVAASILTIASAIALEHITAQTLNVFTYSRQRFGVIRTAVATSGLGAAVLLAAVGVELTVRHYDPQEVYGWGERPSLEPHDELGWRLVPSEETHLRWESYDYTVTANELGFPGPSYSPDKPPNTIRIVTLGDAFTSAEGVDTSEAWPRLLEENLQTKVSDRQIQVLNFGITGYGPNQYAAVMEQYGPIYQPDIVIIGFFVNEYGDVLVTNSEFQDSIGFEKVDQNSLKAILSLSHTRRWLALHVYDPLSAILSGKPEPHRYFLGAFRYLERDEPELTIDGREKVLLRLEQIDSIADDIGAQVIIAMIPAPVQVCDRDELGYYPRNVDLDDASRFDLDQPQAMTHDLAAQLGFAYYDLRPVLKAPSECTYQKYNLHWTTEGHRVAADYLSSVLIEDNHLP
ncbi:MAG: acyltransferase family protein [Chloroflexi bacterium]|nr:acyltransferase family protein [Chloroflexota bacterium]